INAGNCGGSIGGMGGSSGGQVGGGGFGGMSGGGSSSGGSPSYPSVPPPPQIGQPIVSLPSFILPLICGCAPGTFEDRCYEISAGGPILGAAMKALSSAMSTLPNVEVNAKANASAKFCICCDEDGLGLKIDTAAGVSFDGKFSVPLVGAKISGHGSGGGFDYDYELGAGCTFEPSFSASGTLTGKTDCHLKNPQVCATLNASADLVLDCRVGGEVTLKKDGQVLGKQAAVIYGTLKGGVEGNLSYCLGQGMSGKVTVKPVTFPSMPARTSPRNTLIQVAARVLP
ncbi:MAG: hypothetical protein NTW03_16045, partial [Verrucomicrobia bacterium]|nr:hypothetical protein [Verrucomicrobiota bacterium]